jgi:hypothetical protein
MVASLCDSLTTCCPWHRFCDPTCNVPDCDEDGGDCSSVSSCAGSGATLCPTSANAFGSGGDSRGDCICDINCNVEDCEFDGGDCDTPLRDECAQCADGCYRGWLGDGVCDKDCNTVMCNFDDGDCLSRLSDDTCECLCCGGTWDIEFECSAGAEICASDPCMHGAIMLQILCVVRKVFADICPIR